MLRFTLKWYIKRTENELQTTFHFHPLNKICLKNQNLYFEIIVTIKNKNKT